MIKRCLSAMWILALLLALLNLAEIGKDPKDNIQSEVEDLRLNVNRRRIYFGSDGYLLSLIHI